MVLKIIKEKDKKANHRVNIIQRTDNTKKKPQSNLRD
jgi:hypothetical protein